MDSNIRNALGPHVGTNREYVKWLVNESMLESARVIAAEYSGHGNMWQKPFGNPAPERAVRKASVWFTAYPDSLMTDGHDNYLQALGRQELWESLSQLGVRAVHTGPVKVAGSINGVAFGASCDGQFDRISTKIDEKFGTERDFQDLTESAGVFGAVIIDDIIPGHTGKGADFRLAEMNYSEFPGIYHMVEIEAQHWSLLPEVPAGRDSVNLSPQEEKALSSADADYIVGKMQRVLMAAEGVKSTNWSATREVLGVDGQVRRWVYLHYFKEGQPTLNWADPTLAAARLVMGDALHSLGVLKAGALRLDANGFLGLERRLDGEAAWSEGHPLSFAANHLVAGIVRKLGGFTFQELNLGIDAIKAMLTSGSDLSYDFINRPAYHHALATSDTAFLRLTLTLALEAGIQPVSLIHGLQNHDDLTYELVHFADQNKDVEFVLREGETLTGARLSTKIRGELIDRFTGRRAPYNDIFTTNGISCTTASAIAAALGYSDLDNLGETDVALIRDAHVLLACFNALQPGVFAISGWDLCGSLTLDRSAVAELLEDGDTRWIHRGGYDLVGWSERRATAQDLIPQARALYGALPTQLADPNSFASRVREVLKVREDLGLAVGRQVMCAEVDQDAALAMVHYVADAREPGAERPVVTLLNFSQESISVGLRCEDLPTGLELVDQLTGDRAGKISKLGCLHVEMKPFQAMCLAAV